ncbi:MAG: helix-turn-helix domain-containing protein [Actinomycetota bacterium]
MPSVELRANRHAALGDSARLAIVDELSLSDRTPTELRTLLGIESNLLAHHLAVLEDVGIITRSTSSGDARRKYVRLTHGALSDLGPKQTITRGKALFVCTRNSARSQLAAALWRSIADAPAESAGTHPAERVHPGAVAAAQRCGIDISTTAPRSLHSVGRLPSLVITVCDQAHEEITVHPNWLHWSISDPVAIGTKRAFDATAAELRERITLLLSSSKDPQ